MAEANLKVDVTLVRQGFPDRVESAAERLADSFLQDGLPRSAEVFRLQLRAAAFAGAAARAHEPGGAG